MKVNDFEILLIDETFYLRHVQKLIFYVLIKYNTTMWYKLEPSTLT